jgi:hypothetical protein
MPGGTVALSAGAAEAVPTSFFLPNVSRLPQRRDRVPSGAGCWFTEHSESRPRRWRSEERGRARRSEAESLDRCATLGQLHGGSVVRGAERSEVVVPCNALKQRA